MFEVGTICSVKKNLSMIKHPIVVYHPWNNWSRHNFRDISFSWYIILEIIVRSAILIDHFQYIKVFTLPDESGGCVLFLIIKDNYQHHHHHHQHHHQAKHINHALWDKSLLTMFGESFLGAAKLAININISNINLSKNYLK